ncbi:MAG: hypothetical protein Q9167_003240 [Letrouitia subvulpina]
MPQFSSNPWLWCVALPLGSLVTAQSASRISPLVTPYDAAVAQLGPPHYLSNINATEQQFDQEILNAVGRKLAGGGPEIYPYCTFDVRPKDPDDPDDPGNGVGKDDDETFYFDCTMDPLPVSLDGHCGLESLDLELQLQVFQKVVGDWSGSIKKGFDISYDFAVMATDLRLYRPKKAKQFEIWISGKFEWRVYRHKIYKINFRLYPFTNGTTTSTLGPIVTPFTQFDGVGNVLQVPATTTDGNFIAF